MKARFEGGSVGGRTNSKNSPKLRERKRETPSLVLQV